MENNKFQLALLGLMVLILIGTQGCSPLLYSPNAQVIPVLEEGGSLKLAADVSLANPLYSIFEDGQQGNLRLRGTYGLTDFLGLHLETAVSLDTVDYRTHTGIGLGYFTHLEDNTFFQLYATGRVGQADYSGEGTWAGAPFKAKYRSLGIQPGVGYENERYTIGLFTTIKRINYLELETTKNVNENATLLEPAIGFSFRFKNFTLDSELGISFELADKTTNQGYFSIGVGYNLNTRKKKLRTARIPQRGINNN